MVWQHFLGQKQEILQTYQQYIVKKDDQVKEEFFKTIFCYDLFFTSLKEKYYFYSSDGKIDFTHPFLPLFFFNSNYTNLSSKRTEKDWYLPYFPEVTGSVISSNDMFFPWIAFCY